ncbi:MAG: NUDIX hydrolase [Candidatus Aquicultor secundus]|nr:NUDIX hydrolase [Candidatus Aquicultor secundus]NCO65515.1 NUDIX hydrolase [Solirubrobacter sp.]OIO83940.1 MAG: hypothetical protein AUK32_09225 [Candidatus Aquicultor secundus]PIU26293.1 MAG: NUDIX hydrolase [Candidatus Aquicultor secundus]PIW22349.1 MAG: NUDIX hydrolase [Candidatus Aquicultor secundus]PIX51490.1 MAG: NUDIX hydrolase [Candidatus Aquicultor secundus]
MRRGVVGIIKVRPSVVLVNEGKVLLMRYLYGETIVWGIPGGGVAEGESLIDTLKRELDEELGVSIEVEQLLCVLETPSAGKIEHTLHCVFSGTVSGGTPAVNPKHTSAISVEWVDAEKLDGKVLYPPINDIAKKAVTGDTVSRSQSRYLGVRKRQWF